MPLTLMPLDRQAEAADEAIHPPVQLDLAAMRQTAAHFVGMHDFQSFSDDDPDEKSTQVQVEGIDIREEGDLILVRIEGSHFLWKMVRRVVGVLVEVGRGALSYEEAIGLLTKRSGVPARLTAPASGLFLGDRPRGS